MSEQTNNEQNEEINNDIKAEIKAELKAELVQELASMPRIKPYKRILYPVITFIVGLGIGLCVSHFGHDGERYEHHYGQSFHQNGSEHHAEKQQKSEKAK